MFSTLTISRYTPKWISMNLTVWDKEEENSNGIYYAILYTSGLINIGYHTAMHSIHIITTHIIIHTYPQHWSHD